MRVDHCLLCTLLASAVLAQTPKRNADYLRGEQDIWSCKLQEQLNERCMPSKDEVTRRSLFVRQSTDVPDHSPSACTCNNVYFNIWSACCLTNENTHALPSLKEWEGACQEAGTAYKNNLELSEGRLEGLWIPPWAQLPVLGDTFDVMKAVVVASPRDWRLVHILAPIFSCLATLLLVGIIYFVVTRNRRKGRWFGKFSFLRPSLRPVRYEAPKDGWVIEDTSVEEQEGRADIEASKSSLSLDNDHLPNNNSTKEPHLGNVNNSKSASKRNILQKLKHSASNSNLEKNGSTSTLASASRPPALDLTGANDFSPALASKWSDSDSCRTVPQQAKRLPGSATFSALVNHVKIPFGHRPHRLQHVAPDPRFQLDDYNVTPPGSRKPTYDQTIAGILANTGRSGGREAAGRPDTRPANEERQSLITEEDRMSNNVFLISKRPGEDFTVESSRGRGSGAPSSRPVNSDIQVQSPTESNRDSEFLKTYGQPQEQKHVKPVHVPPMPRCPPPVPPSRTHSNSSYPLANVPDDVEKPSLSSSSSAREASDSQSPPSVGLIPEPFRGYAYTPGRYPTPDASPNGPTGFRPLPTPESYFDVQPESAPKKQKNTTGTLRYEEGRRDIQSAREETPRQRPLALDSPPFAPVRETSPRAPGGNHYSTRKLPVPPPIHGRTISSASSTSSTSQGNRGARHWRGLSDEDASSFYLSPSSPEMHVRTLSQDNVYHR